MVDYGPQNESIGSGHYPAQNRKVQYFHHSNALMNMNTDRFSVSGLFRTVLATVAVVLATSASATDMSDLNAEVLKCQKKHDYDATQQTELGPNELAANERTYLDCIYKGIREAVIPKAMIPDDYKYLIKRYQEMTDAVEKGEITRVQRTASTRKLLGMIKDREVAESERRIQDLSAKRDQFLKQRERMLKRNPRMF